MLLYLVPSSLRTGRTLGKHLFQHPGDPDERRHLGPGRRDSSRYGLLVA